MFPWVMLYGVTALLFNHPAAFPDRVQRTLNARDFSGTALQQTADPARDAEQVVAALNAKFAPSDGGKAPFRLVEESQALYSRDTISARVRGPGQEHSVVLDLPSGTAAVSTTIQSDSDQPPFAVRGLKVRGSLNERVKAGLPEALTRLGLAADDAGIAVGTTLVFFVESEGRIWKAAYNVQTGAVAGRPTDAPGDLSLRYFLTELHQAHGYPSDSTATARWFWAVVVDGMFASMAFWGLSGLCMWWQIKAVRTAGALVLAVGLIAAIMSAIAMHGVIRAF